MWGIQIPQNFRVVVHQKAQEWTVELLIISLAKEILFSVALVCLFVCLSFCIFVFLFVSNINITQKVMKGL